MMFFKLPKVSLLCAVASIPLFSAHPVLAGVVLDQFHSPEITNVFQARSDDYQGQTFRVGVGGILEIIKVDVGTYNVPLVDVTFHLAPIVSGIAQFSQSVVLTIASSDISNEGAGDGPLFSNWLNLDFSQFNIRVHPGDRYALVFHSPIPFEQTGGEGAQQINWFAGSPGGYLDGTPINPGATLQDIPVIVRDDFDAAFATYVRTVPEPGSLAVFGMGLAGLSLYVGRSRKRKLG